MSSARLAASITNIFPLLSWAQRELLHELLKPRVPMSSLDAAAALTAMSEFFEPVAALTRGVERCSAEVLDLLGSTSRAGLAQLQRELADRAELLQRPAREPDVGSVMLDCLTALVRSRRSELEVLAVPA